MSTASDQRGPRQPGFLASAVVVGLIVVLGIFLSIRALTSDGPDDQPSPTAASPTPPESSAPTSEPEPDPSSVPAPAVASSVCGLAPESADSDLIAPPDAEWTYLGAIAYPSSETFGPGEIAPEGYPYCYARSPEGAVLAAAAYLAASGEATVFGPYLEYVLTEGPAKEEALAAAAAAEDLPTDTSVGVSGVRLLAYDGTSARIDLAITADQGGIRLYSSIVLALVWADGDWKVDTETVGGGFRYTQIADLVGYMLWSAT